MFKLRSELRHYGLIAAPLVLNNLALAGMQFADTIMVGQLGAEALAAVAVGSAVWFFGFCVSMGLLMSISATNAVLFGEQEWLRIGEVHRQGYTLAFICSIIIVFVSQFAVTPFFEIVGIDVSFRDQALAYVKAISWGALGMMAFLVMRFTSEGVGRTKPIMISAFGALIVNVCFNYLLIYGHAGLPAMGAEGAGYASALTSTLLALGMATYLGLSKRYKIYQLWSGDWYPRRNEQLALIKLGAPIGVALAAEVGLFNAVAILMGTLGATVAASHQIAINFASTTFMIPMAVSAAATVRVGHLIGANKLSDASYSAWVGVGLCVSSMLLSATVLFLYRDILVGWYTPVQEVAQLAIEMLFVAAVFQIVDGIQVGASGVLRAYKDTRVPMLITVFAYWICAFPCAYVFALVLDYPPTAIWWGFVIGLGLAAFMMLLRMHLTCSRYLTKGI